MQAAERRRRDEKSCASGPEAQREAEKATKESKVIDLTLNDKDDDHIYDFDSDSDVVIIVEDVHGKASSSSAIGGPPPQVPQRKSNPSGSSSSSSNTNKSHVNNGANSSSKTLTQKTNSRPQTQLEEWSCQACTLLNPYISLRCEVCDMHRPF